MNNSYYFEYECMNTLSICDIKCENNHPSDCKSMERRFKNAKKIGNSSHITFCDGSKYVGEIQGFSCNGVGSLTFSNGEIYSGFW
jgi:hypothetical protein